MIGNYDPLNNPFGYMPEIPGWDKMTDEERKAYVDWHYEATMKGCMFSFIGLVICLLLCLLFGSCTTTRYVPVTVPEIHEHWSHQTDTILQRDSIISQQTTLIREVDSATMAQYGIQLSALQTAWLIQTDRLQRELSELREQKTDTTVIRDSIPVPYPVEVVKEVPRERSTTEWVLMVSGFAALMGVFLYAVKKVKPFLPGL